jgi:hypothetical protein
MGLHMGGPGSGRKSTTTFRQKFDRHAVKGDACWVWSGTLTVSGYGVVSAERFRKLAHRLSWELHRGPIPAGVFVCHRCDNPPCCNPDHLFLGSNADNIRDAAKKKRLVIPCPKGLDHYKGRLTHCHRGHPFDAANTYVCSRGRRSCKTCVREAGRRWSAKRKAAS